jgi:hypothetical protein
MSVIAINGDFWRTNVGETIKSAGILGASAVLSYLISVMSSNPTLFGTLTPILYVGALFVKNTWLNPSVPNLKV